MQTRHFFSALFRCSKVNRRRRAGTGLGQFLLIGMMMVSSLSLVARCAARDLPAVSSRNFVRGAISRRSIGYVDEVSHFAAIPVVQRRSFQKGGEKEPPPRKKSADTDSLFSPYLKCTRQLQRGAGVAISSLGFLSSSVSQLVADRAALRRWKPTVKALGEFMKTTGIDLELSKSLNGRLLHNIVLLGRVQSHVFEGKDRRDFVLRGGRHDIPTNEEALRYMKYSTAAYGDSMITAAEMDVTGRIDTRVSRVTRTRISDHIEVPEDDIVLLDVDHGGSTNHLRHFVAIDHENKEVVLSIRGTFSLSEMVVDVAGFSRPFCGGEAHSEMANMAESVWESAGLTVVKLLKKHKKYGFVLTGHSLGGGAACLLNILCHSNGGEIVSGRRTRCFAYAPPPSFTPLEVAANAVKDCTAYVHEADAIPFLSIDSVRHFFSSIGVIQTYAERTKFLPQLALSLGFADPDKTLLDDVRRAATKRLKPKAGAPLLAIPAASAVWMRERKDTGKFETKVCDPRKMAMVPIFVGSSNMLQDHFPPTYEHALHNLEDE